MNTILSELIKKEAERLWNLGMAVHWLKPKDKRPVNKGWTSGKRASWQALKATYRAGQNVGVRLGEAGNLINKEGLPTNSYLLVVDCDVKSAEPRHLAEMAERLSELFEGVERDAPCVLSGRGNGSCHYYLRVKKPIRGRRLTQSKESVKVKMPSIAPSGNDRKALTETQLQKGYRIRPAWEIQLLGEGNQVVLPPSLHPDTGAGYKWRTAITATRSIPLFDPTNLPGGESGAEADSEREASAPAAFTPIKVELEGRGLSDAMIDAIRQGEGVEDRSAHLFSASLAMVGCQFTEQEILSTLTNKANYLGQAAYDHAKTSSRQRAAKWLKKYTLKKARKEAAAEEQFKAEVVEEKLTKKETKMQAAALLSTGDWRYGLSRHRPESGGAPKSTLQNVVLILENTAKGTLVKRNSFKVRDLFTSDTAWGNKSGEEIKDDDLIAIKHWLAEKWSFEPNTNIIGESLKFLARKNQFHPVKDYLSTLEWDGEPRLDSWLAKYLEAKAPREYLEAVSRKMLLAMVARIYHPGIKFDHMPVLEGHQGVGKSTAGRILASEQWFCDTLPDVRDKDAMLNLVGAWIVEVGELATLKRADSETYKAFFSRQVDRVRAPYGERFQDNPRQCIFLGTTNPGSYLKDKTGNRRFWPVTVGQCDFKGLESVRDQLLAEAYEEWQCYGEKLWLTGEAKAQAEAIQLMKVGEDEESAMLARFRTFIKEELYKDELEQFNFKKFQLHQLFDGPAAPFAGYKENSYFYQLSANVLRDAGFEKFFSNGTKYWRKVKIK